MLFNSLLMPDLHLFVVGICEFYNYAGYYGITNFSFKSGMTVQPKAKGRRPVPGFSFTCCS